MLAMYDHHHHLHLNLIENLKECCDIVCLVLMELMLEELILLMRDFSVESRITFAVFRIDYNVLHSVLLDGVALEDDGVHVLMFHVHFHPMRRTLY